MAKTYDKGSASGKTRQYRFTASNGGNFGPGARTRTGTPAAPRTDFIDQKGAVLRHARGQLIFWGAGWSPERNPSPSPTTIADAVTRLLAGPYMNFLAQYGVRRASLRGTSLMIDSDPKTGFQGSDVVKQLKQWLDDDRLPEPDSDSPLVYSIIVPPGASTSDPSLGENGTFGWDDFDLGDVDNDPSNYLWVGFDGTLDFLIANFSHEIVEVTTNPRPGGGVIAGPGSPIGTAGGQGKCVGSLASCQIGDPCNAICDNVQSVHTQAYWSIADGTCVVPQAYSLRRTLGLEHDLSQGLRSIDPSTEPSVLARVQHFLNS